MDWYSIHGITVDVGLWSPRNLDRNLFALRPTMWALRTWLVQIGRVRISSSGRINGLAYIASASLATGA